MGIRTLSVFAVGVPGILITAMIVVIAGFSLVSDFDFAAQSAKADFPKYMGWYAALGLIVTLIWLYMEMLRLLTKVRRTQETA
jgi:uncharacterized YccA/Bax inhibitor family protein